MNSHFSEKILDGKYESISDTYLTDMTEFVQIFIHHILENIQLLTTELIEYLDEYATFILLTGEKDTEYRQKLRKEIGKCLEKTYTSICRKHIHFLINSAPDFLLFINELERIMRQGETSNMTSEISDPNMRVNHILEMRKE